MPHEINEEDFMMEKKVKEKYTGPRVTDTATFIQKARWMHGDKYDYSKVEYVNAKTKVEIICKEHGSFWQRPSCHCYKYGCPKCSGFSLNREEWLRRFKKVHGDKYDYAKFEFISSVEKVVIRCPDHGDFLQTPSQHSRGNGCKVCASERAAANNPRRMSLEDFLYKAEVVHGGKYGYSKTVYNRYNDKIIITCKEHGDFYQDASSHLKGYGCKKCANNLNSKSQTKDLQWFIEKAKKVHGDKYDYYLAEYTGVFNKITIICPYHGAFRQSPVNHFKGGCQECVDHGKYTLDNFIDRASCVHGDRYNYSNVEYINSWTNVEIICKIHGKFFQKPSMHLSGQGCKRCGYDKNAENNTKDWGWMVQRFTEAHGRRYQYPTQAYCGVDSKYEIVCSVHGSFWQLGTSHAGGSGCRSCAYSEMGYGKTGYYRTNKPSSLYVFKMDDSFLKVGLSNDVQARMNALHNQSGYSVEKIYTTDGVASELYDLEFKILRRSSFERHYPEVSFGGQSECLELSELPKVLAIIEDWEKNQQPEEEIEEDA